MEKFDKMARDTGETVAKKILTGMVTSLGIEAISGIIKFIASIGVSKISVSEWDSSFDNINKTLYKLSKKQYNRYRLPTTNKERYILTDNISYLVNLGKGNMIKVETSVSDSKLYGEKKLDLIFIGKKKYAYREKFLIDALNLTDKDHILVQHLNEIKCNVIPHSFENIVIDPKVRDNIIKGLISWCNSRDWYKKHQMTHKIGVFLYGKPGTGKSTIAKAISTMFDNAPILTIDPDNTIGSIKDIIRMRQKYNRTIIVLIEDFDMFFKRRNEEKEEESNTNGDKNDKKGNPDINQNIIFQLLDGIYSTDNTIYIATTNHKNTLDPALIRYGRFDIQEELKYFNRDQALECVKKLDYGEECLDSLNLTYPVQPSYLQSMVMEYRAKLMK